MSHGALVSGLVYFGGFVTMKSFDFTLYALAHAEITRNLLAIRYLN